MKLSFGDKRSEISLQVVHSFFELMPDGYWVGMGQACVLQEQSARMYDLNSRIMQQLQHTSRRADDSDTFMKQVPFFPHSAQRSASHRSPDASASVAAAGGGAGSVFCGSSTPPRAHNPPRRGEHQPQAEAARHLRRHARCLSTP